MTVATRVLPPHDRGDSTVLRAALRRAEAERDAKGAFLSYIAHELRSPLTAVIGWADLLRDTQLSQDQREMVGIMHRSVETLVGVVNNVLDLAKLEADRVELDVRPLDARSCVEECLDLLAASAAQKGLELAYAVDESVPARLLGDAGRLRQILINLVGNAVKFTEAGHVVVSVTTRRLADGRHEAHVAVSDTGPGIPPERRGALFDEFMQADARLGGSGLGLSISRRLVEMMGGRIWIDSELQKGTTAHFTIVTQSADSADLALCGRQPDLLGKRLCIVHENATMARMLAEQVGRWGMQAYATTQAQDVLERLRAGAPYDLILVNQQVAGMDGRSLASAIRRVAGAESVPLVFLTSLGGAAREDRSGDWGDQARFAAYLGKPVKHGRLHEVLVRLFTPGAAATEGRAADRAAGGARASVRHADDRRPQPRAARGVGNALEDGASGSATIRVLIADDDPAVRRSLERLMRSEGTDVVAVGDGAAALEEVGRFDPDVVLLDVQMPQLDGFEVCRRLKDDPETRLTPVVLVTGAGRESDRVRGIEAGADDFIIKPPDRAGLQARVRALADLKRFTDGLDRVESVLVTMARCIEGRDPATHGHCERLSNYASRLGKRLNLDAADIIALRLAGIVHDIGKVAVPDAILHKPGPLTPDEWQVMWKHPVEGEQICSGLTAFRRVLPIIRHHHERMDGSGYPDGLRGAEIPVTARVLQMVDIYDALTTNRPYKAAFSSTRALEIMQTEANCGWRDPRIFGAFEELVREELEPAQQLEVARAS